MKERAEERHVFNGPAERQSLFTVAHLCSQKRTMRRTEREKRGRIDREIEKHSQGDGHPKVGSTSQQHNRIIRER